MNELICYELSQLIERKINYRNKYIENPKFQKNILDMYDSEIDLLEKIESFIVNIKSNALQIIDKEKKKAFKHGREDGYLMAQTGRSHDLFYYEINNT
jgi:hypothetical protein